MREIVVLVFLFATSALAEISSMAQELQLKKEKIEQLNLRQEKILKSLVRINTNNKRLNYELDKLLKEKELVELNLEKNILEIKSISTRLYEGRKTLTDRVKALGKFRGENILKSMLTFPKLTQIEKNIKMMGLIAAHDVKSIQDYYNDREILREKIEKSKKRIAVIKELEKSIELKREVLNKEYKDKVVFLERVRKSKIFNVAKLKELNKKFLSFSLDDSGILDLLNKESLLEMKGKLPVPIVGTMMESFGFQNNEDFSTFKNSGVFVGSDVRQNVKAVYSGKIIEQGFLQGLGNYIIIDHGDNYYSVYGNISNIKVEKDNLVNIGQEIAMVDNQYVDGKIGLYFELRHYANVLNPHLWIGGWDEANSSK